MGAISPVLMALYRAGELNLDQMMAFAISEDHARQQQVLDQLGAHRPPYLIRRAMTEAKVAAHDRRALFIGAEAYTEAGGTILRDLFTEDGGGWFEDVSLLDRLAAEKLAGIAEEVSSKEGWKWAEARLDYPHADGLSRVYPHPVERPAADAEQIGKLAEEYDALVNQWEAVEELPPEVEARFKEIDAALQTFGDGTAYDPEDVARGGVFVMLGQDGVARIERGFIRPEDMPAPEPEVERPPGDGAGVGESEGQPEAEEFEEDTAAPLSERLVLDLTAQRTAALRDSLACNPEVALSAVVHVLAAASFYPTSGRASCLEIRPTSAYLEGHAPAIGDSPAGQGIQRRHERWASRLPNDVGELSPVPAAAATCASSRCSSAAPSPASSRRSPREGSIAREPWCSAAIQGRSRSPAPELAQPSLALPPALGAGGDDRTVAPTAKARAMVLDDPLRGRRQARQRPGRERRSVPIPIAPARHPAGQT